MATKETKTIAFGQVKKYARVADRLMEFRNSNPNGLIETTPTITGDTIVFKTRIVKDKSDANSAEATGHAMGENKGTKAFEKLESVSVGRALALLGYASDGEIASSEEMEEFEEYKAHKFEEMLMDSQEKLEACTSVEESKTVWGNLPVEAKTNEGIIKLKDTMKAKLTKTKTEEHEGN